MIPARHEGPLCSCIIIHYRNPDDTASFVRALTERTTASHEIIVVDNQSPEPYDAASSDVRVRVVRTDVNGGYGHACNAGAAHARGRYLLFLNNDCDCREDIVTPLCAVMERDPVIGVLAPRLVNRDGSHQQSFGGHPGIFSEMFMKLWAKRMSRHGRAMIARGMREHAPAIDTDWVTGAAVMLPRRVFDAIGGFDERYFMYFEDSDLCRRVADRGHRVCLAPAVTLTHFGGGTGMQASDHVLTSYRMGQLRYYARFNHEVEFALLKTYLMTKFLLQAATRPARRAFALGFCREILAFNVRTHTSEHVRLHASQEM